MLIWFIIGGILGYFGWKWWKTGILTAIAGLLLFDGILIPFLAGAVGTLIGGWFRGKKRRR